MHACGSTSTHARKQTYALPRERTLTHRQAGTCVHTHAKAHTGVRVVRDMNPAHKHTRARNKPTGRYARAHTCAENLWVLARTRAGTSRWNHNHARNHARNQAHSDERVRASSRDARAHTRAYSAFTHGHMPTHL
eukprot:6167039-Pleurochrysis_carterae.AAC.2